MSHTSRLKRFLSHLEANPSLQKLVDDSVQCILDASFIFQTQAEDKQLDDRKKRE